jgi:hypothetical protein
MKKLIASVLALAGIAGPVAAQKVQTLDPGSILFTTPTLSDDLAPLEPLNRNPSDADVIFHEDEWSQVEFLAMARLAEVQRMLKELKSFERTHRAQHGWRQVFVRRLERTPVIAGSRPIHQLEDRLGAKAGDGPLLFSTSGAPQRVKDGFSLPLGGNVTLYGYAGAQGVPLLGAHVGGNPDDFKLTQAFMKLNASHQLLLVDWRAQIVLVSVTKEGQIDIWRP